jgi:beta-galactosidase
VSQIGDEMKLLAPVLKGTKVVAETAIIYSHANSWALQFPMQPSKLFQQREHAMLFYNALHDRNIPVDFVPPPITDEDTESLSKYKVVFAPSLHLLAGGEADRLKLYVQTGGTLVSTFNTGLVDEHNIAPDTGYPHDLSDLFGLEVQEFDPIPADAENHVVFKGAFPASHLYSARIWCDIIEPKECEVLATFSQDFYAGRPAMTVNQYGLGRAVYIGTMFPQPFYYDLINWLRQVCSLFPLLKVPDTVEVSMRQKDDTRIYFLLNHQTTPVRVHFYKPVHDYLTGNALTGNYDLPPHGVLVLDEKVSKAPPET